MNTRNRSDFSRPGNDRQGPPRKNTWAWILGSIGALFLLCCGGGFVGLVILGSVSPDTSVYVGKNIPSSYIETARELGALEPGETPKFFYSDGFTTIKDGFYLVTETKVAIYTEWEGEGELSIIKLSDIDIAELERDESFLNDSYINLETKDGEYYSFPVSSEHDRDEMFFDAIKSKVGNKSFRR